MLVVEIGEWSVYHQKYALTFGLAGFSAGQSASLSRQISHAHYSTIILAATAETSVNAVLF